MEIASACSEATILCFIYSRVTKQKIKVKYTVNMRFSKINIDRFGDDGGIRCLSFHKKISLGIANAITQNNE